MSLWRKSETVVLEKESCDFPAVSDKEVSYCPTLSEKESYDFPAVSEK